MTGNCAIPGAKQLTGEPLRKLAADSAASGPPPRCATCGSALSTLAGACRPAHPRIRRVRDWTEVEEALAELALRLPHR